jgi:AcrR family transcriptional regulator
MGRAPVKLTNVQKRQAVIDAALALTARDGPNLAIADVSKRSGVSRQTIYNHFQDRNGLLTAVAAVVRDRHCPLCPDPGLAAPEAILEAYAEALLSWVRDPGHRLAVCASARGIGAPLDPASKALQPVRARLATFFSVETWRGRMAVAEPEFAARQFLDLTIGAAQLGFLIGGEEARPTEDIVEQARRCARLFCTTRRSRAHIGPPLLTAPATRPAPRTRTPRHERTRRNARTPER